jgi:hypothetical protein
MGDYPEWQQQFEETLQDFPDVTFIAAHYCKHSPDIEKCGALLDKYPNLFADISMGGRLRTYLKEISNDPLKFREFIIRYQDKLLWGSDVIIDSSPHKNADFFIDRAMYDITLLETGQYRQEFQSVLKDIPPDIYGVDDVQLFGLDLPDDVLQKLYFENPQKVFRLAPGSGGGSNGNRSAMRRSSRANASQRSPASFIDHLAFGHNLLAHKGAFPAQLLELLWRVHQHVYPHLWL